MSISAQDCGYRKRVCSLAANHHFYPLFKRTTIPDSNPFQIFRIRDPWSIGSKSLGSGFVIRDCQRFQGFSSPLHTICHCSQTRRKPLFREKKLSIAKYDENTSTHYSSSAAVFVKTENITYYNEKSALCLSGDRLLRQMCFVRTFFTKAHESFSTPYSRFTRVLSICQFLLLFTNNV